MVKVNDLPVRLVQISQQTLKDLECLCHYPHIHNLKLVKYISKLTTFANLIGILYKPVSG